MNWFTNDVSRSVTNPVLEIKNVELPGDLKSAQRAEKFYFIIKLIIVFLFKIYLIEFLYISIDL